MILQKITHGEAHVNWKIILQNMGYKHHATHGEAHVNWKIILQTMGYKHHAVELWTKE